MHRSEGIPVCIYYFESEVVNSTVVQVISFEVYVILF
jgi:hypothetical protein